MEKDGTGSKEGTFIKSTADKASKITPGIDSKENDHQPTGLNNGANEVVLDIEKECDVSKTKEETPLKASLIFQYLWRRVILVY